MRRSLIICLYSALSAYMFFVQDYRERIKSENPDVTFGEVGKLLGAKWKEMNDTEKKASSQSSTSEAALANGGD